jgi:DNA polymerase III alpha subunit
MSARAIVTGVLFRAPVEKISKNGKPYLLVTIRDGKGEAARWWKAFIFAEEFCDEIRRFGDGEPIAVAGEIDCQPYEKGGEWRLNWSVAVDAVLSARKSKAKRAGRKRQSKEADGSARTGVSWASPAATPLNDSIPSALELR